ncbi:MAG: molybdopterin-dependent oxidoreductase, partial [Actinomycetota bacterium]|nr:molybdopterin-dependent oxidoreductase [Actinomycetota bacterium]
AGALREAGGDVVVLVGERGAAVPGALAAAGRLTDALDAKLAWVPRRNNARGALNAGLLAGLLPGGHRLEVPEEREVVEAVWGELPGGPGRSLHEILEAAAGGEIDVLHLIGTDLVRDFDRPRLAKAALERVSTVIVQDLLRTETVRYAHVVLPAMGAQERSGTYTNWEGRRQRFWRAVPAPTLVQEDWDIITQLVSFLGHHLGFSDLDGIRADMARIGNVAPREWPSPEDSSAATRGQEDGDGERLPEGRLHLLTYPLLLDRGVMSLGADDMLKTAKSPFAALNAADARRLGVSDGQTITLASDYGRLTLTARVEDDVIQDVVYLPSNSTEEPAAILAGALAGPVWVTVEPVDARVASMFGGGLSAGPTTEPYTRGDSGLPREGGPW